MITIVRALALLGLLLLTTSAAQAAFSRVWIAEFSASRPEAAAAFANLPVLTVQPTLDISVAQKTSAPFNAQTRYIRVVCEVQCAIRIGGVVTANDVFLPALRPEYFGVSPGATLSVVAVPP